MTRTYGQIHSWVSTHEGGKEFNPNFVKQRRSIKLIRELKNGNWHAKVTSGFQTGKAILVTAEQVANAKPYNAEADDLQEGDLFLFSDANRTY